MDDWQREMERYLAHFARSAKRPTIVFSDNPRTTPTWTPAVDMYETEAALVVVFELAGVDASRTEVRAEGNRLVVKGVRRERHSSASPGEHRTYHALEVPYGRFERSMPLPPGLDSTQARARYHDGLLEVTLPKRASRKLRIAVGDSNTAAPAERDEP